MDTQRTRITNTLDYDINTRYTRFYTINTQLKRLMWLLKEKEKLQFDLL